MQKRGSIKSRKPTDKNKNHLQKKKTLKSKPRFEIKKNSLYVSLAELSNEGIILLDNDQILYANSAAVQMLGVKSFEDIKQMSFISFIHKNSLKKFEYKFIEDGKICKESKKALVKANRYDAKTIELSVSCKVIDANGFKASQLAFTDITEKKKNEELILKLSTAVEQSEVIVIITDKNGTIEFVNPKFTEVTGYSREEAIGAHTRILKSGYYSREQYEELWSTITSGKSWSGEFQNRKKNGDLFWESAQISPIKNSEGEITHFVAVKNDITHKKKSEQEIALLAHSIKSVSEYICITDIKGIIIFANDSFLKAFGYNGDEIIGKQIFIILSSSNSAEAYNAILSISAEKINKIKIIALKKNGGEFPVSLSISAVTDENGNPKSHVYVGEDISGKQISEQALKESEQRWKDIIDFLPEAVFAINNERKVIAWNKACESLTGFKADILLNSEGEFYYSIPFYGERRPLLIDFILGVAEEKEISKTYKSIIKSGDSIIGETFSSILRSGHGAYLWAKASPLYDSDGKLVGAIEAVRDITTKIEEEKNLIAAKEEAEKASQMKSEFLAQVSHEIRTPVSVILNFASLLREGMKEHINEESEAMFNSIQSGGRRLIRTVDMMLNMSQLLTGNVDFKESRIDIYEEVLSFIIKEFLFLAKENNNKLTLTNKTVKPQIIGDSFTISQLLQYIIDNAVKFTHNGEISAEIYRDKNNNVCVDVKDNGVGISEDFIPHMFKPFSQEESGYARGFEGNGLGLALAKKYAELNDVEIFVDSKKGKGTVISLTFNRSVKNVSSQ